MIGSRRYAGTILGGRWRGERPRVGGRGTTDDGRMDDGRRRGKRPRSEDEGRWTTGEWTTGDGVASGHGRRRTRDDGRRRGKRPRSPEGGDDRSNGVAGHGRRRTTNERQATAWWATVGQGRTKAPSAKGFAIDGRRSYDAQQRLREGRKQNSQDEDRLLRTGLAKRNKATLCPRCCARQAHTAVP